MLPAETSCRLLEDEAPNGDSFEGEKSRLSLENTRFGELFSGPIAALLGPTRYLKFSMFLRHKYQN